MIAHIVLFTPKPNISRDLLLACAQLLERLAREVPGVVRASVGRSVAVDPGYPRPLGEKTYQNACVIEFDDKPSLLAYLTHPLHRELGRLFWELCESAVVLESEMVDAKTESLVRFLV
ncbi:MAG TPA: Dabb family protein [Vicinamibacterales bacterium]|nr:Dabb family protein [Vicinamibacterales bacterium]